MSENFSIAEVPSLRAAHGPVSVDIGDLSKDEHFEAFVQIFAKFIQDNKDTLGRYQSLTVVASKPVPEVTMKQLSEHPNDVGRLLYLSFNPEVRIILDGNTGKRALVVAFDNPSFEFVNAL